MRRTGPLRSADLRYVLFALGLVTASLGAAGATRAQDADVADATPQAAQGPAGGASASSDDITETAVLPTDTDEAGEPDRQTASVEPVEPVEPPATPPTAERICRLIAESADRVGMPKPFFARLIWKESRFDIKAISPVGARGIAQFMPYTANERGLDDPYDYEAAIRHSADYLKDIHDRLGNWGLAAAGYNGGPNRVAAWMRDGGTLPYETREYVNAITYKPVDWFRQDGRDVELRPLDADLSFMEGCAKLPVMKTRAVFASTDPDAGGVPMKPWGVQVAGNGDRSVAMRIFQRVKRQFSGVLGGKEPLVIRDRAPAGRIYAVRIGADSRAEGMKLCDRLRSAGGSCIVKKN